jgi:hypothetical protein
VTGFERRWVQTIARALVPPDALDGALDGIDVGARYDEELRSSPWTAALVLRLAVWATWLSPMWLRARPQTFGGLDEAARVALLERLLKHRVYPVRMMMMVLKLTLCQLLLGDTATLAQLGAYDLPRPLAKRGTASR